MPQPPAHGGQQEEENVQGGESPQKAKGPSAVFKKGVLGNYEPREPPKSFKPGEHEIVKCFTVGLGDPWCPHPGYCDRNREEKMGVHLLHFLWFITNIIWPVLLKLGMTTVMETERKKWMFIICFSCGALLISSGRFF